MAKRKTRDQLREEYVKLLDIWQHSRAFLIAQAEAEGFKDSADSLDSSEKLLAEFDANVHPASELVSGMRATLNELATGFASGLRHSEHTAQAFVAFYLQASGRDFFDDMGRPEKRLKAIVQRGKILNEDEYYSLKCVVDDDSTLLSNKERQRAENMMGAFEFGGEA